MVSYQASYPFRRFINDPIDGWVYTNDVWNEPRPVYPDEWKSKGLTRRRRWVRRIHHVEETSNT